MTRQTIFVSIFIFFCVCFNGQTPANASFFLELDKLKFPRQITTDKVRFSKNCELDISKSKPYLDSIVWFMNRNKTSAISIYLDINDRLYCSKPDTTFSQLVNLTRYLFSQDIYRKQIVYVDTIHKIQKKLIKCEKPTKIMILVYDNAIDTPRTKKPNCLTINEKQYTQKIVSGLIHLNDKSLTGSTTNEVKNFLGKPNVEHNVPESQWTELKYYPKNCDNKFYKSGYLHFEIQRDTVSRIGWAID